MTTDVDLIWDVGAQLGEGPAWFVDEAALRFVDIKGGKLHRYDPASGATETLNVGGMPSFVLPTDDGKMVIGSHDRILPANKNGVVGSRWLKMDGGCAVIVRMAS